MTNEIMIITEEDIKNKIYVIRGKEVMLDRDLDMIKYYKADEDYYNSYDHEKFKEIVYKEAMEEEKQEAREEGHAEGL